MDRRKKIEALGLLGEKIVRNYFSLMNYKIIDSPSIWDPEKDFTIFLEFQESETVEVKTQHLYYLLNAFTINDSQIDKARKVDRLIFVQPPHPSNGDAILLWEAPPKDQRTFRPTKTTNGKRYYIKLSSCKRLSTCKDLSLIEEMISYDTSYSRQIIG